LRPKVEIAVKSGALPVVLGGDDSIVLATVAGVRRYFRDVSLIYVDRDAGLNVPATTPSGCVDGMVISHVLGRGAPELVRFWGEPPLVREPDVVLFGVGRLDEPEQKFLNGSALRRYMADDISRMGAGAAAEQALDRAHGQRNAFVLHVDLDVIASEDFGAANLSAPGGLSLGEVRQALAFWARQPNLGAIEISGYNPALDSDGSAAKRVIDLLVEILAPRLEAAPPSEAPAAAAKSSANASTEPGAAELSIDTDAISPNIIDPNIAEPDIADPSIVDPNTVEPNTDLPTDDPSDASDEPEPTED
jgi:arginase